MKASETAVLLVEFQNEWLSEAGSLHFIIKDELKRKKVVPNTLELVRNARQKGASIVHVPISFSPDYREIAQEPRGVLHMISTNRRFQQNSDAVAIPEEYLGEFDVVVEGRRGGSGFTGSNLDFVLRSKGIRNVVVAGFATEVCVESTIRDAYDRGYRVILASDCSAAHSDLEQKFVEEKVMPFFGEVFDSNTICERLK